MSIHQDGVTLSPKTLMVLIAISGILITIGGYVSVVKDAPKDISALTVEHRDFEKEARDIHDGLEKKDSAHDVKLTRIETNQTHMMTGINDIKTLLRRTGRRHTRRNEGDGG